MKTITSSEISTATDEVRGWTPPAVGKDSYQADRRLRVLLLIKGLGPGGAERLLSLCARLGNRESIRYEVAYLLPWKRALVGELIGDGISVRCLNGGKEWDLRWALRLRGLLLARRPDIIHVHSPYVAGIARLVVRTLPHHARPALVYTEHLPWTGYHTLTRALNTVTFPLDDAQFAVSREVRASIPRLLRSKISVAIHGISPSATKEPALWRRQVRVELGIADDEVVVGTISNYRAQKGYSYLLDAAKLVLDGENGIRFLAVGDGPLGDKIRARHQVLALGDQFLLLGRRDDAQRILCGCDIFVLASLYEGLSIALVEALSLGLPVVATSVPGIREAVTHGEEALLVPPRRPDLLAWAIATLAADPVRREEMGRAALDRSRGFDITRTIETVEATYRCLMRRRHGSAAAGSERRLHRPGERARSRSRQRKDPA